jgi:hypothetical protein
MCWDCASHLRVPSLNTWAAALQTSLLSNTCRPDLQFAFAFVCKATDFGEFKRSEFTTGCEHLNVSTLGGLKQALPQLRDLFNNESSFEQIYNFAFPYMCEKGKKIMGLEQAISLWKQLFQGKHTWGHTVAWCLFLQEEHKRAIVADTWRLMLPFVKVSSRVVGAVSMQELQIFKTPLCHRGFGTIYRSGAKY